MSKKIGTLKARLTELAYPYYRLDFTRYENVWDSDDEENEAQWSHSIRFAYTRGSVCMLFRNTDEITYNTAERYTARVFYEENSTTIMRMVQDTMAVRRARGDPIPPWPMALICRAAEGAWDRLH